MLAGTGEKSESCAGDEERKSVPGRICLKTSRLVKDWTPVRPEWPGQREEGQSSRWARGERGRP